jgi:hypothetical protein
LNTTNPCAIIVEVCTGLEDDDDEHRASFLKGIIKISRLAFVGVKSE